MRCKVKDQRLARKIRVGCKNNKDRRSSVLHALKFEILKVDGGSECYPTLTKCLLIFENMYRDIVLLELSSRDSFKDYHFKQHATLEIQRNKRENQTMFLKVYEKENLIKHCNVSTYKPT